MIKKLGKSLREYKKDMYYTFLLLMGEAVLEVLIPFMAANLVNNIQAGMAIKEVIKTGAILVTMAAASLACGGIAGFTSSRSAAGFAKNLRKDIFVRTQSFSFENIDKFSSSSLVTRMTTDVNNLQFAYMMIIRTAVRAPLMIIFCTFMAFYMGGKLAFFATDGKSREDFLQHVEPDGSPESVWELRLLIIATDVFHLVWHANYGNMCIVTSYDRLKRDARRIECDIDAVLEELEPKERSRLESWDMTPSISATGRALGPFASPPSPRRRNRSWRSGRGRVCDSKTAFANR